MTRSSTSRLLLLVTRDHGNEAAKRQKQLYNIFGTTGFHDRIQDCHHRPTESHRNPFDRIQWPLRRTTCVLKQKNSSGGCPRPQSREQQFVKGALLKLTEKPRSDLRRRRNASFHLTLSFARDDRRYSRGLNVSGRFRVPLPKCSYQRRRALVSVPKRLRVL